MFGMRYTPCRNMPRKRSKSIGMPERGYRGVSRKSKAHFKVRWNSPRIAAHAAPYLRDPNDRKRFGCKKPCPHHRPLQPGLYAPPVCPPGSYIPLRANVSSFKHTAVNRQHCRFLKQKTYSPLSAGRFYLCYSLLFMRNERFG